MRVQLWRACRAGAHRKLLGTQESPHDGKVGELQQDHADVRARDRQREPNERGEGRLHRPGGLRRAFRAEPRQAPCWLAAALSPLSPFSETRFLARLAKVTER